MLFLKRARTSQFADVSNRLYDWCLMAVCKNIYPDGPKICQKAKEIAQHLEISEYKASSGWLENEAQHSTDNYQWGVRRCQR